MHRLLVGVFLLAALPLHASSLVDDVRAADTARIMATIAGDVQRLAPLLSDALTYGHADGRVQTKADFLDAVKTSRVKYEAYDYEEANVTRVDDNVATMTGRAKLRASAGTQHVEFRLRFLSVWRRESDTWRLLAYQSVRLPEPTAGK
ncbi:MAG: nuclear transport factor 2 family protein [Opitutaceae bacterium]|nr:nuclear transport factor 2 family protein [Opitutaceae bacterium]